MKKSRKGIFLITMGLLLLAAALCITGYNIWDEYRADKESSAVSEQLNHNIVEPSDNPAYELNPDMEMPQTVIDGVAYIGVIEIPAYDIELPVTSEWSYSLLKIAPCRYSGSIYKDNMVIAGHNYRSHFSKIKSMQVGDLVIFTDMDGNEFRYKVDSTEILNPEDVVEMTDSDWDMTLFTCTTDRQHRFALRCERIE